jgi:hypothetical protein
MELHLAGKPNPSGEEWGPGIGKTYIEIGGFATKAEALEHLGEVSEFEDNAHRGKVQPATQRRDRGRRR